MVLLQKCSNTWDSNMKRQFACKLRIAHGVDQQAKPTYPSRYTVKREGKQNHGASGECVPHSRAHHDAGAHIARHREREAKRLTKKEKNKNRTAQYRDRGCTAPGPVPIQRLVVLYEPTPSDEGVGCPLNISASVAEVGGHRSVD